MDDPKRKLRLIICQKMAIIKKFRIKSLNKKTNFKVGKCFIIIWKQTNLENINFEINKGKFLECLGLMVLENLQFLT